MSHMPLGYLSVDWLSDPQQGLFSVQLCTKKRIINVYSLKNQRSVRILEM